MAVLQLLVLLILANAAPVAASHLCGDLWRHPIDGGLRLRDEAPLFGRSKTWRGLAAATLACALAAPALGLAWTLGAQVGLLAMLGDLAASFVKRRMKLPAGARAPRLDSLPEALLPAWCLREDLGFGTGEALLAALGFVLTVRLASPLLYRLRLRPRPW